MQRIIRVLVITTIIVGMLLFVGVNAVRIGLNNSRGDLSDVIAGQFDPGPQLNQKDVSQVGDPAGQVYTATLRVDTRLQARLPDEYLSFSIDTSQLVGGKWWNPDAPGSELGSGTVKAPPIDLNRPQLDKLVSALAPAYVRIGGSEADKVFYNMQSDQSGNPPSGYDSVLSKAEWDSANGFAKRNGLKLVFTLNAGPGARNINGTWDPTNAESLLVYSAKQGYSVAGWEFGNEVNIYWFVHGLNKQVSPKQYISDFKGVKTLVKQYFPDALISAQGSAYWPVLGEPLNYFYHFLPDFMKADGQDTDVVSWHYYPQQSKRGPVATRRAFPGRLLNVNNLNEVSYWASEIRSMRNQYAPNAQTWMGETGNAQFGGEPGLSDAYLGGLWWLDQLGLLARYNTQVVVRQTLTGMNYGLIDDATLMPRPDYWNSLLWKKLMGEEVYKTGVLGDHTESLRVYAQSLPGMRNGYTILIINLDPKKSARISIPDFVDRPFEIYGLSTPDLFSQTLLLNGVQLKLDNNGNLPVINGLPFIGGGIPEITLNPLAYAFVSFPPIIATDLVP